MGVRISVQSLWTKNDSSDLTYEFTQERVIIGRTGSADVQLPHAAVSTQHATIQAEGTGYVLVDEGSTNGTRINGERIPPGRAKPLRTGDEVDVGGFRLVISVGVPIASPTTTDKTSALARQMVRELLSAAGDSIEAPRLTVLNGPSKGEAHVIPPPPSTTVVGRAESCDLVLVDADASREHIELVRDLSGTLVRDLDSKNGLTVNGRLTVQKRLEDRDELQVGGTLIVYEDAAAAQLVRLQSVPDEKVDALPTAEETEANEAPESTGSREAPRALRPKVTAEMLIFGLAGLLVLASIVAIYWLATSQ